MLQDTERITQTTEMENKLIGAMVKIRRGCQNIQTRRILFSFCVSIHDRFPLCSFVVHPRTHLVDQIGLRLKEI